MIPLLILTPLILLAAIGAVWKARPVHAALLLALTLALNAVLYLLVGAHFIGLVQFMVYVGAVAVLIVFSLLITRPGDEADEIARRPKAVVTGLICTVPVLGVLLYALSRPGNVFSVRLIQSQGLSAGGLGQLTNVPSSAPGDPAISLEQLGTVLFTTHAPAVLTVAILLTAVLIGAALFAREPSKKPKLPSDS